MTLLFSSLSDKDELEQAKPDTFVDTVSEALGTLTRIRFSSGTEQEKVIIREPYNYHIHVSLCKLFQGLTAI